MGKLAELNIPTREGNLRNPERLNQGLKDIGRKAEPLKRLATEGFGQVLLGDEGTIPWYMSFAPGADLTDKLMEGRQPGLLDVPGPGTLAKIAMLPIMKLGAKEILEGTARMGKTMRNIEKTKDARDFVTRYHRTLSKKKPSIEQSGLTLKNPDYGTNTGDTKRYMPVIWLANNPTDIPVLRRYEDTPGAITTYKVKIPRSEYYDTPRLRFVGGRGGRPEVVDRGKESWTNEGRYKIDTFGKDIPYERLEEMDPLDVELTNMRHDRLKDYGEASYTNGSYSQLGNRLVNEDLNWMPFRDRIHPYLKLKELSKRLSKRVHQLPDTSPHDLLDAIFDYDFAGKRGKTVDVPGYGTSEFFNVLDDNDVKPLMSFKIPTDKQLAKGSVSRGLETPINSSDPKQRVMNWGIYQDALNRGMPPSVAMGSYGPREILIDYPQGLGIKKFPKSAEGLISRGLGKGRWDMKNRLSDISEVDDTRTFNAYLKQIENPHLKSVILEKIFNSDGALGRLKDPALGLNVFAASGHVGRGYAPFRHNSLTGLLREGMEYNTKELGLPVDVARERTFKAIKTIIEDNIRMPENRPSAVVKSIGDLVDDRTVPAE